MKTLRKIFAVSVIVLTIVAMSGISPVKAAAQAGDLIKKDGLSTVYYLGADGKRYVFPNDVTYFSWYKDFSGVVTVSATELSSYPLGANIVMRAGTKMVKITSDPSVYVVEPNGVLRKIQSEADATALFGANWAKRVVDVADSFFTNYTIGTPLTSGTTPVGSLVKTAGSSSVYYYDGSVYRMIATEAAFNANRFSFDNVITVASIGTTGTDITGAEEAFTKTSQLGYTGGVQPGNGTGLTASLSSTTPAGTGIPAGSPVDFLKVNLTASNDGNVNVSSIVLTAYDLSDALNIDDVTFYDNGVKVGTSKNMNSDRIATFNFATPIVVNAGTTKTLTVKATIAAGQTGTYGLGVAKAADIVATGTTISGSFPIVGNSMSVVSATNLGTVTLGSVVATPSTNNFGEDNVLLASFDLAAANEAALLQSIKMYNGGTNSNEIVSNLKLYIDGTEAATGTYVDRYATFTLNNYEIAKGDTVLVEVKGDLGVTSVNDTVKLYIKDRNDFVFVGKDYGFGVQLTTASWNLLDASTEGITVTLAAGDFTMDFDKSATTGTPAKDVKAGDNDVVLATMTLKSNAENVTISSIADASAGAGATASEFELQGTGLAAGELENVEMVDVATGGVYDITATRLADDEWNLSMTDEISLVKGVAKKFLIRADMSDTVGAEIDNNDTIKVVLDSGAITAEGDTSGASITNITPSSLTGSIITVKDASLEINPVVLTNTSAVGGATDVVVYQAMAKVGTSDGIKLQSFKLTTNADASDTFADTNITRLDLYVDGKLVKSLSNSITEAVGAGDTINFSSFTSNNILAAGVNVPVVVKASFASTISPAGVFTLKIAALGDVTSRSVTGNKTVNTTTSGTITTVSRQVTTVAQGTLKVELATTDVKANRDAFILGGSSTPADRYMGELKFTTANEAIKVTKLALVDNGTATDADIKELKLVKADGTVMATQMVQANGDVVFDPLNITFAADQTTSLFLMAVAKGVNVDGDPTSTATVGRTLQYNINPAASSITATGADSGAAITIVVDAGGGLAAGEWSAAAVKSRTNVLVGSKLNSIVNDMADATLAGGTGKVLGKYKFTFENGSNRTTANEELKAIMDLLTVTFSKSSAVVITNVKANIDGTSNKVAASTLTTLGAGNTSGNATWNTGVLGNLTTGLADGGKVDGTVTLVITGDVVTTTNEYVQSSIVDLSGTGSDDDFSYFADGLLAGTSMVDMYLPVTDVVGGTLSN